MRLGLGSGVTVTYRGNLHKKWSSQLAHRVDLDCWVRGWGYINVISNTFKMQRFHQRLEELRSHD